MHYRVSADTSSETIRALRESGQEPVFSVDEHKTLSEIMAEIDWSAFDGEPVDDPIFESTREPVYHLDADMEEQLASQRRQPQTQDEQLAAPVPQRY